MRARSPAIRRSSAPLRRGGGSRCINCRVRPLGFLGEFETAWNHHVPTALALGELQESAIQMQGQSEAVIARALRKLIRTEANRRDIRKLLGLEVDPSLTKQEVSLLDQLERAEQAKFPELGRIA